MGRQGVRSEWRDVPATVRQAVDELLGSPVTRTSGVPGGFSPGPAVRADLGDGRTVFIKAVGTSLNAQAVALHRREAIVLQTLAGRLPAPNLLGHVDDGDWVVLVVDWVDGRTPDATDSGDVTRLLALLHRLADGAPPLVDDRIGTFAEVHRGVHGNWEILAADPPRGLDEWSRRNAERLAELDRQTPDATAGECVVHADVRTDNVLLAHDRPAGDVLVDWPGASLGAPWIDLIALLPALHLDGGPPPADVFASTSLGRAADPAAVDAFVASVAGYFTRMSLLPAPPGLPTVRAFQAAQGVIARAWAGERLDLP